MALTTEQVALWKRNAEIVNSYATDIAVKILQDRIIALADEVLANREAQPVAWHFPGSETESAQLGYDHELDDEQKQNCIALYTAPPAPAVPEEMKRDPDADVFDPGFMNGWNACRAAMLGGDK